MRIIANNETIDAKCGDLLKIAGKNDARGGSRRDLPETRASCAFIHQQLGAGPAFPDPIHKVSDIPDEVFALNRPGFTGE